MSPQEILDKGHAAVDAATKWLDLAVKSGLSFQAAFKVLHDNLFGGDPEPASLPKAAAPLGAEAEAALASAVAAGREANPN